MFLETIFTFGYKYFNLLFLFIHDCVFMLTIRIQLNSKNTRFEKTEHIKQYMLYEKLNLFSNKWFNSYLLFIHDKLFILTIRLQLDSKKYTFQKDKSYKKIHA